MKKGFVKNVGLNGLGMAVNQLVMLSLLALLSRWLSPEDFGVYATISVILTFGLLFSEFGASSYIVHKENCAQSTISTLFILNVTISLIIIACIYLLADKIALFFNHEESITIVLSSLSILFYSMSSVYKGIMQKELKFEVVIKIDIASVVLSAIISFYFAMAEFGIYALVIQGLTKSIFEFVLLYLNNKFYFKLNFDREEFKKIWDYSLYLLINNILNQTSRTIDQIIIGKWLTSYSLGIYTVAYKIMLFPVQRVTSVIAKVLFPTLALQRNNQHEFNRNFYKVTTVVACIVFPAMSFVFFESKYIVRIILGENWTDVGDVLKILAPIGAIQSLLSLTGVIFLITGKTKLGFKLQFVTTLVTVLSFIIGINYGLMGVCYAYLCANIILFFPMYYITLDLIRLDFIFVLKTLVMVALTSIVISYISHQVGQFFLGESNIYMYMVVVTLVFLVQVLTVIKVGLIKYAFEKEDCSSLTF
ncbi:TPA: oligosaccharide flippase family protein [Vibrio vulnificus]|nr:oligosaccharide flippase family protein [Vibrio vulnificus]HAS8303879.1 lipopolysaccharide biosynthesis protein [Vibrio vulnificus]